MSYSIKTISRFEKNLKRLSKKYASLKTEYIKLISDLKENPKLGVQITKNCYKVRLAIKSKGKGKSGGARVITHLYVSKEIVYLLAIYDKSDKDDLSDKELEELLKLIE